MPIFRGKNFVSAVSDYKDSVRVALRTPLDLSYTVSQVDGVTLNDKDRILLAGQSSAVENGIYSWSSTTSKLTRSADADSRFELSTGMRVYVEEGNSYSQTTWIVISTGGPITPGISSIVFAKENKIGPINNAGSYGGVSKTLLLTVDETGQIDAISESEIELDGGDY